MFRVMMDDDDDDDIELLMLGAPKILRICFPLSWNGSLTLIT